MKDVSATSERKQTCLGNCGFKYTNLKGTPPKVEKKRSFGRNGEIFDRGMGWKWRLRQFG